MTENSKQMDGSAKQSGGSGKGKKSGTPKVSHNRPADMMNITNGIQRLQINSKHSHQHTKSPPVDNHSPKISQTNGVIHHHQTKEGKRTSNGNNQQQRPKSSGNFNDAFSKKDLYAGAGFDISPAASSLPIPNFANKNSQMSRSLTSLASPSSSPGSISNSFSPPIAACGSSAPNEAESLRLKSEYLMKILSKDGPRPSLPTHLPPPNTEQLEEMTAQVRRLLNL